MATVDGRAVGQRPRGAKQWAWTIALLVAGVVGIPVFVVLAVTLPGTIRDVREYRDAPVCATAEATDCRRMLPAAVSDLDVRGTRGKDYYARFEGAGAPTGWVKVTKSVYQAVDPGTAVQLEQWRGDITGVRIGSHLRELDASPSGDDDTQIAAGLSLLPLAPLWLTVGVGKARGRGTFGRNAVGDRPRQAMHAAAVAAALTFGAAFLSLGLLGVVVTWAVSVVLAAAVLFFEWRAAAFDARG
ncbi:hypothetical protein [Yinghuangia seranimata]|uniref:hypothetical protein n=1 Tax=Yinghuangia seranimata TaxID=408067 RepID=UPI00248B7F89|nr:hypothetical protein [Yinghuangia seranimata]MDI2128330.1 hypothetical protein [Yinghuangia seranimata]